jgi:hypothetical protein
MNQRRIPKKRKKNREGIGIITEKIRDYEIWKRQTQQRGGRMKESRNGWNPRGAPSREE